MKRLVVIVALLVSACGRLRLPTVPVVPTNPPTSVTFDLQTNVSGANINITPTNGDTPRIDVTDGNGHAVETLIPTSWTTVTITVTASGYNAATWSGTVASLVQNTGHNILTLTSVLPDPPTRAQALDVHIGMQGVLVHTVQYGDLHWFEAPLPWLNAADRQAAYAATKASGNSHIGFLLPTGAPVYNECCNDFSPDRFGPLDWSKGETDFTQSPLADLVVEIRQANLLPVVFPDERCDHSQKDILLALDALQNSRYGDLSLQVAIYMAGYDGVFYGCEPSKQYLPGWAAGIRQHCPLCRLGMEFNVGHIPQEAGIDMSGFDAEFIEFEESVHTWNAWQIIPRLIGEGAYRRPADDNSPHPVPRMNMQTPRGEIQTVCFEWKTYPWVRSRVTADEISVDRQYLINMGCRAIG